MVKASAQQGAIACGHPTTARAAAEILSDGGNAFDAIIAAYATACVAEPVLASLCGGGFLMAQPSGKDAQLYDFFVDSPLSMGREQALDFEPVYADFGTARQEFHIGLGSIAVPGGIKGLFAIHRELASQPLPRLLEPAIRAAREGTEVRDIDAFLFQVVGPILLARPDVKALHCGPDGKLLAGGSWMKQPDLADCLEALAHEGDDLFYRGEMGQRLVELCRDRGGLITQADLDRYEVVRRRPLHRSYRGFEFDSNPPPSAGAVLIAVTLDLMAQHQFDRKSLESWHCLGLAMDLTGQIRRDLRLETLLNEPEAAMAKLADLQMIERYRQEVAPHRPAHRGTTHISVADSQGNLAAMTLTNGEGCAEFLPGSGIILNNMLGEEDLNPAGFHQGPAGERLSSMMAPSVARFADGRKMALGSGGSNRIRSAILQVLLNIGESGLSLEEAITAPRLHVERGKANLEEGLPTGTSEALSSLGLETIDWPKGNLFFGGVHAVEHHPDGTFDASGDPRRGGVGLVI